MQTLPPELDWNTAPGVLDGAVDLHLTPEHCGLDYWIRHVCGGMLAGLENGHRPQAPVPDHMLVDGPLRRAIVQELAFRSLAEEKAARAISRLVLLAPDRATMEFYSTQLVDEARHAAVFRHHLVEVGIAPEELDDVVDAAAAFGREHVLEPLEQFAFDVLDGPMPFHAGVLTLTVLVEGVLAPASELSERKWRPLDPAAAEIERGAGIDEIRHLAVGSTVVQRFLQANPQAKDAFLELLGRGMKLWQELPIREVMAEREELLQQGLAQCAEVVGDYEVWPGRRLLDTTVRERLAKAVEWSEQTQNARLSFMGLVP